MAVGVRLDVKAAWLKTLDTVEMCTPARRATSRIVTRATPKPISLGLARSPRVRTANPPCSQLRPNDHSHSVYYVQSFAKRLQPHRKRGAELSVRRAGGEACCM